MYLIKIKYNVSLASLFFMWSTWAHTSTEKAHYLSLQKWILRNITSMEDTVLIAAAPVIVE